MAEFKTRSFAYAHSNAVLAGLKAHAKNRGSIITDEYAYIEEEGETTAFYKMLEVARKSGKDILYVDSVKEFAGKSLSDFKAALTAIADASMEVYSMTERDYDYAAFVTAIKVLEDLTPAFRKRDRYIAAVTMYAMETPVSKICADLELSKAEVFEAIASYERGLEETGLAE